MAIEDVLRIMPPPAAPIEVPSAWSQVEADIGSILPKDYKAFVEAYGSGRIASFLWIFNPASGCDTIDFVTQAREQRDVLTDLRGAGDPIPYPSFPEEDGLLAAGMSDNGDVLYWRATGRPDDWTIVVKDGRAPEFAEHDSDLTGFLQDVLSGASKCRIFPDDFPSATIAFEPM